MQVRLLLFLIGCFVGGLTGFDIDNAAITVNVVGTELTITIPENPDVKSIFFFTEITDECSAGYTFLHTVNSSNLVDYKQELKKKLNNNDMIRVLGVFETHEQVITKSYDFKIDANGNGVKQKPTESNNCNRIQLEHLKLNNNQHKYSRQGKCIPAEWSPNNECSGNLIFEENFNDKHLNNWTHGIFSRLYSAHVEFTEFLKNDVNSVVKDGQLHITATVSKYSSRHQLYVLPNCTNRYMGTHKMQCGPYDSRFKNPPPPLSSATIRTQHKIRLKYGRYEIRARMPIGEWLFPYIMLQPSETELESDPEKHIRIAYARGDRNLLDLATNNIGGNKLFSSAFIPRGSTGILYEEKMSMPHKTPGAHFGDDFHDYTMIWHKDRIIFKVDGITYGTLTNQNILDQLNSSESYFLVLGLTAGGRYNFPDDQIQINREDQFKVTSSKGPLKFREYLYKCKTWTHPKLVIDHVRVYATDPSEF